MEPYPKRSLPNHLVAALWMLGSGITGAGEHNANILPEGAFDIQEGQFFAGWKPGGFLGGSPAWNNSVTAETEPGSTAFVRIRVKDENGTNAGISQTEKLVLNPAWKSIKLRVQIRITEFQKVAAWGGRGQLTIKFSDHNDGPLPSEDYLGLSKNSTGWEEISQEFRIPPGAANMSVEVQFIGATGIMDLKNLRALPAATE